jgi:hypothetical protein
MPHYEHRIFERRKYNFVAFRVELDLKYASYFFFHFVVGVNWCAVTSQDISFVLMFVLI